MRQLASNLWIVDRQFGHDPAIQTNIRLKRLLKEHLGLELTETYATNAFVFIKSGGMSAALPASPDVAPVPGIVGLARAGRLVDSPKKRGTATV